jgi:hypothetical protein
VWGEITSLTATTLDEGAVGVVVVAALDGVDAGGVRDPRDAIYG